MYSAAPCEFYGQSYVVEITLQMQAVVRMMSNASWVHFDPKASRILALEDINLL